MIVPDASGLNVKEAGLLDGYVKRRGKVLLTGSVPRNFRAFGKLKSPAWL